MPISRELLLLGLPWAMGVVGLLVDRAGPLGQGMLLVSACLFGLAAALFGVIHLPLPGPGAARFVALATLATFAFPRVIEAMMPRTGGRPSSGSRIDR